MDYEIYQLECPICNGVLKVDRFLRNDFAHRFNVYKCIDCGEETQDMYPINMNMYWRFFKVTDEFFFKLFVDKNVKEVDKKIVKLQNFLFEVDSKIKATNAVTEVIGLNNIEVSDLLDTL